MAATSSTVDPRTLPPGVVPGALSARLVGVLVLAGALLGTPNLLLDGVLLPGPSRWVYGATMLGLAVIALVLVLRNPVVDERWGLLMVLAGDAVYATVVLCLADPGLMATPMMLLFATFTAAWLLEPRTLGVHLAVTVGLCWLVLAPDHDSAGQLAVQVAVNSGVLGASAVVLMVLRRRIARLAHQNHLLARVDPLTGLPNRRSLVEQAPALWRHALDARLRVVVLLLDLDHFKDVNDRHGHVVGDAVLVAVAERLRQRVPAPGVVARTGGEEVVVLAAVPDPHAGRELGEELRRAIASAAVPAQVGAVSASVGVALDDERSARAGAHDVAETMWGLVERADAAMYAAKAGGRDRVVVSESRRTPGPDQLSLPIVGPVPAPRALPPLPVRSHVAASPAAGPLDPQDPLGPLGPDPRDEPASAVEVAQH